jgi:hypothetical protein
MDWPAATGRDIVPAMRLQENKIAMTRKTVSLGYFIILFWMIWPLLCLLLADVIAACCASRLTDGGVASPCIAFGLDISGVVGAMVMLGMFFPVTLLTGGFAFSVFSAAVLWKIVSLLRQADRTAKSKLGLVCIAALLIVAAFVAGLPLLLVLSAK